MAEQTESPITPELIQRLAANARLLHGGIGLATEAGEYLDRLKKEIYYNGTSDPTNQMEELGDILWYIALICNDLGITIEDCMKRNIAKLRKRYPNKFTEYDAEHRDLDAERAILEGNQHDEDDIPLTLGRD